MWMTTLTRKWMTTVTIIIKSHNKCELISFHFLYLLVCFTPICHVFVMIFSTDSFVFNIIIRIYFNITFTTVFDFFSDNIVFFIIYNIIREHITKLFSGFLFNLLISTEYTDIRVIFFEQSWQLLLFSQIKLFIFGFIGQDSHCLLSLQLSQFSLRCGIFILLNSRFHFNFEVFLSVSPRSRLGKSLKVMFLYVLIEPFKSDFLR